jgi:hypothetical protein
MIRDCITIEGNMSKYCNSMKSKTGSIIECKVCDNNLCNGIDRNSNPNGLVKSDGISGKIEGSDSGRNGKSCGRQAELKIFIIPVVLMMVFKIL